MSRKKRDPKVGTGKKPKGSGRRLYTDENPKDTVSIKFATPTDARNTVRKVKKDRLTKGFGTGLKYGTFGVGALAVGSGAYNLATGQRKVRVKKQTAKEINKMKKTYNI